MIWPHNKKFAFTIFDDTDNATVENIRPVYNLLNDLNIKITKSVWPLASEDDDPTGGQSLEDPEYLDFILKLQDNGFEIGYHGARAGDNPRNVTEEALDLFRDKIGHNPYTYAQHARSIENVYWGMGRTSIPLLKPFVAHFSERNKFLGDDIQSPYFWGDLCKQRIKYCRNYGLANSNLLKSDPWTPYFDPRKPFVNNWFSNSGMLEPRQVDKQINQNQIKKWEDQGALIIMFAHFAHGFVKEGINIPAFEQAMRRLALREGWFVPVNKILDYILTKRGEHELTSVESLQLELRWALHMGKKVTGLN